MRRAKPEKREILPDVRYNSMHCVIFHSPHYEARQEKRCHYALMYDAMDIIKEQTGKNPMEVFEQALKNVGPVMEVRPRRVGGATYQVPMEVPAHRRMTLAMRWIIDAAHARTGKSFSEKLAAELMDASNNTGSAVRKREETHKMAEANRAFSHYRM